MTRPNIAVGAFIPIYVGQFAEAGSQDGMPTPGHGNALVGTCIGIGRASTAGMRSFSATC